MSPPPTRSQTPPSKPGGSKEVRGAPLPSRSPPAPRESVGEATGPRNPKALEIQPSSRGEKVRSSHAESGREHELAQLPQTQPHGAGSSCGYGGYGCARGLAVAVAQLRLPRGPGRGSALQPGAWQPQASVPDPSPQGGGGRACARGALSSLQAGGSESVRGHAGRGGGDKGHRSPGKELRAAPGQSKRWVISESALI